MAKEKKEIELETTGESEIPIDVKVEKENEDLVSRQKGVLSASNIIKEFENGQLKKELPDIYVGDTVKVGVKITEGNKERVQAREKVWGTNFLRM